jgi:hypothetical protein
MESGQQPEQNPGADKVGGVEGIMLEIDAASSDLGDFLRWVARAVDEDPDIASDFQTVVGYVYSYARAKNEETIVEKAEGDG